MKQWREYAKTLQQWGDSDGAGVLYTQAINLMVEKGQVETRACAELHLVRFVRFNSLFLPPRNRAEAFMFSPLWAVG